MEIIGTNQYEKDRKSKKTMIGITIAIIILFIISIILCITIYYLKEQQFKFYVDGQKTKVSESELFVYEGDTVYVSLKDIAPIINYNYYNGGYKEYSEDSSKCYLESENEICTFEKDSNIIYKTPYNEIDYSYYNINKPIKKINNKLYITKEGLCLACNLGFFYEPDKNTIKIYTIDHYAKYYTQNYKYSAVSDNFKNQKALLYGLMIVQNMDNTEKIINEKDLRYGIYTIDGKEIVGTKYTSIEFIESTQEFIVKTTENKVGIITADGDTKVSPQYDSLKQIDKDLNLYLATNNGKKGVIEKNGKILIYLEYDEIGINPEPFQGNNIKNSYLLFNNVIPVKQNGKWGLYDKKGNLILPIEYDGMGCIQNSNTSNNVLIIPDIKGIVIAKEYELEKNRKTTLYGIVNSLGRTMVPAGLEKVYSVVTNGREEYSMIYQENTYNVIEWANKNLDLLALNNEETTETNSKNETKNEIKNEVNINTINTNEMNTNVVTN